MERGRLGFAAVAVAAERRSVTTTPDPEPEFPVKEEQRRTAPAVSNSEMGLGRLQSVQAKALE